MTAIEMREKFHRFIETVEDKRLKAIFNLFENEIVEQEWDYTDEFKKELDLRYNYIINGGVMVSSDDAAQRTSELMKRLKGQ
jgi:hypothetical protein